MGEFSAWLQAQGIDPLTGGLVLGFIGGWLLARLLRGGSRTEAQAATRALNGEELKGRAINVNEARPRPEGSNGRGGRSSSQAAS